MIPRVWNIPIAMSKVYNFNKIILNGASHYFVDNKKENFLSKSPVFVTTMHYLLKKVPKDRSILLYYYKSGILLSF